MVEPVKDKQIVIVGDSAFAEIAYEYFTYDSTYTVVGFAVEKAYITRETFKDLPVVALEEVQNRFPPDEHEAFVALTYSHLNRTRTRLYHAMREKGYRLASYVSSRAFVWRNVTTGDNVFIFEDNTVQPFVTIGGNVILWSGNHIGHHSHIGSHSFISSHVVISGFCTIGESCFFGVNASVANNLTIGEDNFIGFGVKIAKSTADNTLLLPAPENVREGSSARRFCKVKDV
jgi:sugar O-acyltransferase (sialic acid O-acetyltransferase NeuD family)